ncbi:autophagocytosis associated protein [Dichotomocladium elegans]|nr:autophagocytosis associated protein [Dichotomocladium elegans]
MNRAEFNQAIAHFVKDINGCTAETKWSLEVHPRTRYQYLTRTVRRPVRAAKVMKARDGDSDSDDDDGSVIHDDPATARIQTTGFMTLEHHVVYSPTFQVPVLYFNGYDANGSALSLDAIYDSVLALPHLETSLRASHLSQQGSITQTEHPILGFGFWHIHPCDTQNMMTLVAPHASTENYIKIACIVQSSPRP